MEYTKIGTEVKLALNCECAGLTMSDFDFEVIFYTFGDNGRKYTKSQFTERSDGSFSVVVDTSWFSAGEIKATVIAHIPDGEADDGIRDEIVTVNTGVALRR